MLIIGKGRDCIVNADHITKLYVGGDGCAVKVEFQNGQGTQMGRYDTNRAAITAIEMLVDRIKEKRDVVVFPDDESVKQKIIHESAGRSRLFHGKKTKSHGGS